MENNFLLTFDEDREQRYAFFETELELKEFVAENSHISINAAFQFTAVREITDFTITEESI